MISSLLSYILKLFHNLKSFFCVPKVCAHEPRTIKEFRTLAERGNPLYQYKLAQLLLKSKSEYKNLEEIVELLQKAASSGLKEAQRFLGLLYKDGFCVVSNSETSISCFQSLASQGDTESLVHLAAMENEGTFFPDDPQKLEEVLIDSAKNENPFAQFHLAVRLVKCSNENLKGAANWARKAKKGLQTIAENDDIFAQYNLGIMCQEGIGIPKDPTTALKWYKRAASMGFPKAMFKAAMMLLNGEGVPLDREEGLIFLDNAAKLGLKIADDRLTEINFKGPRAVSDLPKHVVNTKEFFQKTLEQTQANFLEDLGTMLLTGKCLPFGLVPGNDKLTFDPLADPNFKAFLGDEFTDFTSFCQDPVLKDKLLQKDLEEENAYAQVALGCMNLYGPYDQRNFPEAASWFKKAAEQKNALGQVAYGTMLYLGLFGTPDPFNAVDYFYFAAVQGNADAQNNLALSCFHYQEPNLSQYLSLGLIFSVTKNYPNPSLFFNLGRCFLFGYEKRPPYYKEAAECLQLAATQGISEAEFYRGLCYVQDAADFHQNPQIAIECFEKGAFQGDALSQLYLGVAHIIGFGVPKDILKGDQWLLKAAAQNSARAQLFHETLCALGLVNAEDNGNFQNHLYQLAESGDDLAQYSLGIWSLKGGVVPKNPQQAGKWLRKAAALGNMYAQNLLGLMFFNRVGFLVNYEEAFEHFKSAAEKGLAEAQFNLSLMYFGGISVPQDPEEGYSWIHRAAGFNNSDAQYLLGSFYLNSEIGHQSTSTGVRYLFSAANLGQIKAQSLLGLLYLEGKFVPQDLNKSFKWLKKAAKQGDAKASELLKTLES